MGEAHAGSHAGNLMNMFSYLGVSQKPTGQHRGECEKVSDSQGPVPVPVHVFRGRKDQAISSITTGGNLNYSCLHPALLFYLLLQKWGPWRNRGRQRCGLNAGNNHLTVQRGAIQRLSDTRQSILFTSQHSLESKRSLQTVWGQGAFRQRRPSRPHRCMTPTPATLKTSSQPHNPLSKYRVLYVQAHSVWTRAKAA